MGSLKLILKNLAAIFTSNVISILIELIQFPLFLHSYSTAVYADWLALSSAVSYLSTLNFGLQTYVNQDLAIRYNRGEMEGYHVRQSTALRALIGTAMIAAAASLVIFVLPIERWLNLSLSHFAASLTLYFIALQVLMGALIFSYFSNAFMGVGLSYRGNNWNNAQRFLNGVLLCTMAVMRQPLFALAIGQFLLYVVLFVLLLMDLKRKAPDIFPTLTYWDKSSLTEMLKPSAYFALIYAGNFLAYEMPILLLRKFAGATPVIIFNSARKIFSSGRQILTGLTQSIGPEVTRIFGQENWDRLYKLYDYSERIIFFLVASLNVPLFLASPILIEVWSRHTGFFDLPVYALLGLTAVMICIKEHKMQFQFSTNTHIALGRVLAISYMTMTVVSGFTIHFFGLRGFAATWLVTESFLVYDTVRQNKLLFEGREAISGNYVLRLTGLAVAGFAVGSFLLATQAAHNWSLTGRIAAETLESIVVVGMAWYLFHVSALSQFLKAKVQAKFRKSATA